MDRAGRQVSCSKEDSRSVHDSDSGQSNRRQPDDESSRLALAEPMALRAWPVFQRESWEGGYVDPWGWQVSSPTQRSLAKLRKDGWPLVQVVEQWVPGANIRRDLWQFIDVICLRRDSLLAVQTTTGSNLQARMDKIALLPSVVHWLDTKTDRRLFLHGWSKRGARGKRKLWTCREVEVVLNETGKPVIREP